MRTPAALALLATLALAGAGRTEILDSQPTGFSVREVLHIAAPPGKVWDALGHIGAWWDSAHTFSGDARNLSIELKPGGFWLETLPGGGGARHMVVVDAQPPRVLRLQGALGPLQAFGVAGSLTWSLKDDGGQTLATLTYDVGGHAPGGLDKLAAAVDGVLSAQAARLKAYAETGKAS